MKRLLWLRLVMFLFCCIGLPGCKKSLPPASDTLSASASAPRPGAAIRLDAVTFYKPFDSADIPVVDLGTARSRLAELGVTLPGSGVDVVQIYDGETVLGAHDGIAWSPIASFLGDEVFEWETLTAGRMREQGFEVSGGNLTYRHRIGKDLDDHETVPYLLHRAEDGTYLFAALADHSVSAEGVLRRAGNRLYTNTGKRAFEFIKVAPGIWKIEGNWYDGFNCGGSVLWSAEGGRTWYSAIKEFGLTTVTAWTDTGLLLQIDGIDTKAPIPAAAAAALRPCAINRGEDLARVIESLEYDESFGKVTVQSMPRDLVVGETYTTGQRVRWDDSVWVVLEARPETKTYYLLNDGRTFGGPGGNQYERVYKVNTSGKDRVTLFASSRDYLLSAAARIHELSDARLSQQQVVADYMNTANEYLRIAEAKANQVGAGWGEFYKPVVLGLASFVSDASLRAVTGGKVLGVNVGKDSLVKAAVTMTNRSDRLVAAVFLTALQGMTLSAPTIAANFEKKSLDEHLRMSSEITGYSAAVNGLRSWFPVNTKAGVAMSFTSGLVMRWRKIKIDERLGYENKHQALNLLAGGGTALATVLATNKGPGVVGAIGQGGFLLSEIISGRGTPGVIAGTSVEMATQMLVKHPVIRPFATVLSAQVSALTQLGDAYRMGQNAGAELDRARAMRLEQVQKANSITYVLKHLPNVTGWYSGPELNLLLSTAQDPFSRFREELLSK